MTQVALRKVFTFCLTFALFSILGRANIIVSVPSVTPAGGGEFSWSYDAKLVEGFQIQPSPAGCASPPAPAGSSCDGLITIYDFSGYVADSQFEPDGWIFVGAFLGETPIGIVPGSIIAGVDDPLIFNLSWLYSPGKGGPTIEATSGNLDLGLFGARSVYAQSRPSEYSARSNTLAFCNGRDINSAITLVPQVPEPASLLLFGSGLFALAFAARRKRRG